MNDWIRVSKRDLCSVCGKPDYCTYSPDLGLILCMRVESDRPSRNSMGGWLHSVGGARPRVHHWRAPALPPPPSINCSAILLHWAERTTAGDLAALAARLGVSEDALAALNAVWHRQQRAWAFPMRSGDGSIVGIRLRADDGQKWAVKGSRQGLFLPVCEPQSVIYVAEGPTDTAAALTLGLFAAGRPSCCCGGPELRIACQRLNVRRAVLVADNDKPGLDGAQRVAKEIGLPCCIWVPPAKDIRDFLRQGGTKEMIEGDIRQSVWRKL